MWSGKPFSVLHIGHGAVGHWGLIARARTLHQSGVEIPFQSVSMVHTGQGVLCKIGRATCGVLEWSEK